MNRPFIYLKLIISLVRVRFFRAKIPVFASFAITERCNYKCQYCDTHRPISCKDELSTSDVKSIISTLKSEGLLFLHLSGGEPLLRHDIVEIVKYSYAQGISISLNTNGSMLDKLVEIAPYLSTIMVSLDGNKEVNDMFRSKGSFDTSIKALVTLKKIKCKDVLISSVLHKKNIDHFTEFIADISYLNIPVAFQPIHMTSGNKSNYPYDSFDTEKQNELLLTDNELHNLIDNVLSNSDILKTLKSPPYLIRKMERDKKKNKWQLMVRNILFRVNSNGTILYGSDEIEWDFKKFSSVLEQYHSSRLARDFCFNSINIKELLSLNPLSILNLLLFKLRK
ncbi:MAG: radical SAM protein [Bacteriovoracaceae bacterium]|nr:radical SAM protein [Bacteriovoracaceae bacterium]